MSNTHRCCTVAAVVAVLLSPLCVPMFAQTAAPPVPSPLEALLADARALIDDGKARDAIARLQAAGAPEDARIDALTGVAYYHADEYESAVKLLRAVHPRLAKGAAERREAEKVLGLSLHLMGRYADAIPWLERARAEKGDTLELSQVLAVAYLQTQQPDQVRAVLARIFAVPAESATASLFMAQLMIRFEHNEAAEEALKQAVAKDPKLPRAHFLLGQLALFRGRFDDAVRWTEKELELNPSDAMAFSQLGDAYVHLEKWELAIAALQRSIWINPYYSAPFILLGRAYMRMQQPAAAEGMLRRAVEYDPNNRQAHYVLARVLQQLGRAEDAKRELEIMRKLPQRR
ncbi:MAG: tetratricopeptide repeat protein [Luteitalea sp.]|nr:tetratricopeptide repeat protein [Luteitalea sp.]